MPLENALEAAVLPVIRQQQPERPRQRGAAIGRKNRGTRPGPGHEPEPQQGMLQQWQVVGVVVGAGAHVGNQGIDQSWLDLALIIGRRCHDRFAQAAFAQHRRQILRGVEQLGQAHEIGALANVAGAHRQHDIEVGVRLLEEPHQHPDEPVHVRLRLDLRPEHLLELIDLVIDETGFLKQGKASCGVGRQYTGSAGKITNCQIGVFAAYVSDKGHALIDRQLYLPKAWTSAPERLAAAHVPPEVTFATKPRLAVTMITRALAAAVPFAWLAADSIYGVGEIEMVLRCAYKGYVLGVTGQHQFWSWGTAPEISGTADEIAQALDRSAWMRLSAGPGSKGPRLHDWAYLELATLPAEAVDPALDESLWTRGLLIRRNLADASLAYFTTWCPAGTPIETLVAIEGRRWAIEDAFETAKTELGLATTRPAPGMAGTGTSRW